MPCSSAQGPGPTWLELTLARRFWWPRPDSAGWWWPVLVSVTHPGFLAGLEDPPGPFIAGSIYHPCLWATAGAGGAASGPQSW